MRAFPNVPSRGTVITIPATKEPHDSDDDGSKDNDGDDDDDEFADDDPDDDDSDDDSGDDDPDDDGSNDDDDSDDDDSEEDDSDDTVTVTDGPYTRRSRPPSDHTLERSRDDQLQSEVRGRHCSGMTSCKVQ